jgi:hypothetical protein
MGTAVKQWLNEEGTEVYGQGIEKLIQYYDQYLRL